MSGDIQKEAILAELARIQVRLKIMNDAVEGVRNLLWLNLAGWVVLFCAHKGWW